MRTNIFIVVILSILVLSAQIFTQTPEELETVPTHKNERGFSFSLATSGIGLGGFYRWALPSFYYVGIDLEFFVVRDDDEIQFYDPVVGRAFTLNDINRLFLIPLNIELKKRLFTNDIEDNFRPHVMVQGGAIFGMNFPKERQTRSGVIRPDDEFKFSYNFLVGFGVDFTTRKNFFATIRPQYRITYFPDTIAGKKNHSSFEIKLEIGGQL